MHSNMGLAHYVAIAVDGTSCSAYVNSIICQQHPAVLVNHAHHHSQRWFLPALL